MRSRGERLALNQTIFRAATEAILAPAPPSERLTFICECADDSCLESMELTPGEYAGVRGDPRCFAVLPGHEDEIDEVVARLERFSLVEKVGVGARVAEERDPRASVRG